VVRKEGNGKDIGGKTGRVGEKKIERGGRKQRLREEREEMEERERKGK